MSEMVPPTRPRLDKPTAIKLLARNGVAIVRAPALLGLRGYYRDTMGKPGQNDAGIYDDALFLVSLSAFAPFNANTDPSRDHPGVATLVPGVYEYKVGIHGLSRPAERQYEALVQAGPVTVSRSGGQTERGYFGINIHRGSRTSTSSEGCQTIHPDQWSDFLVCVKGSMKAADVTRIPYVLADA
jgi:hypothetical protein